MKTMLILFLDVGIYFKNTLCVTFVSSRCFLLPRVSHLLKVLLLLLGVGVVKAHDELAFERDLVVLVEQSGLGVADMQISGHKDKIKSPGLKMRPPSHNNLGYSYLLSCRSYPLASGGNRTTTLPISAPGKSTNLPTSCFFSFSSDCRADTQTVFFVSCHPVCFSLDAVVKKYNMQPMKLKTDSDSVQMMILIVVNTPEISKTTYI